MKKILTGLLFTGLIAATLPALAVCPLGGCPQVSSCPCPQVCPVDENIPCKDAEGCPLPCMNQMGKPAMTAAQAAACPHCRYLLNTCPTCPKIEPCPCPIS